MPVPEEEPDEEEPEEEEPDEEEPDEEEPDEEDPDEEDPDEEEPDEELMSFVWNVPVKLPVKPSPLQLPPKKEHNTRPNNRIKKRNNASVFIV